ncbi:MAG: hypothetical protein C0497_00145 [Gemmatimonas sp.]|nr:hypothetical protein [Gemmatimonas sp.]
MLPASLIPEGLAALGPGQEIGSVMRVRDRIRGLPYTGAIERLPNGWVIYLVEPVPVDERPEALPGSEAEVVEISIGDELETVEAADSAFAHKLALVREMLGPPAICMGDSVSTGGRIMSWTLPEVVVRLARMKSEQRLPVDVQRAPGPLVSLAVSADLASGKIVGSAFGQRDCPKTD